MKIKDLKVNEMLTMPLVVLSAVARETKTKKAYLAMEFFDGTDKINGNYWDWSSGAIPEKNAVLDVSAQVTEYMGVKQLNIKALKTCTTKTIADFAPESDFDISATYSAAYDLMSTVSDNTLRRIAIGALEEFKNLWLTVPGAISVHHNYLGGTLVHSYGVACKAKVMAEETNGANVDLAIVGGMLHDIGKLSTYQIDGASIDMTDAGRLYEHAYIGASTIVLLADKYTDISDRPTSTVEDPDVTKIRLLQHIVLSHHGKLEYGAVVVPHCIEAYIVNLADMLDATNEQIRTASAAKPEDAIWTDKVWALSNHQHLTHQYISRIMH